MKLRIVGLRAGCLWCAAILLCGTTPSAQAFWGSSARGWINEADGAMERGRKAETEQRVMDACDAYSRAHELYRKAQTESPGTRSAHVTEQDAECRTRLRTLFARAAAGQVSTPTPEEVMPTAGAGEQPRAPEPPADDARARATAAELDTTADQPTAADPATPPKPRQRTWLDRVTGRHKTAVPPSPVAATAPPAETGPAPTEGDLTVTTPTVPRAAPRTPVSTANPPSDAALSRQIQMMLADGAGADAVILMESVIEKAGGQATLTQQLLFAQALLNRRNYARAESVLTPLLAAHRDDPAVMLLAAGLNLAQGRPIAALRLLDQLVQKYPRYADAYVNLAYTRFAMSPSENRDEAIVYYRHALTLGAARDPRLETELRVVIAP